nr:MAG TPA: holin [Caudoviricetes sp.]
MTTLATVPAVLALVTLAKDLGLSTRLAAPLAVVLGVILAAADHALAGSGAYAAAADGLLLGLGAAGLYDAARLAGGGAAPTVGRHTASE